MSGSSGMQAWGPAALSDPRALPAAALARAEALPVEHPLQHPSLWHVRPGGVVLDPGGQPGWVYGLLRPKRIQSLIGAASLPVFLPIGNELGGHPPAIPGPATIIDLLAALPTIGARALLLDEVDVDSPLVAAVEAASSSRSRVRSHWLRPATRSWLVDLPADRERYWDKFSSKSRSTLFRKSRKVTGPMRAYREPAEAAEFLRTAAAIAESSWQYRDLGLSINIAPDGIALEELLARQGAMRNYVLHHEGAPVAFIKAFRIGSVLFYDNGAYDQAAHALSPGMALWVNVLQDILANEPEITTIDFGFGDATFKEQLGTRAVLRGQLLVHGPDLRLRLAAAGQTLRARLRAMMVRFRSQRG